MKTKEVKNYQCVMKGAYLVKNSNAMYQALYDYMANENYSKKRLKEMLRWVPTRYPAFVLFHDQTFDAGRILMDSLHLNRLKYWLVLRLCRRKDR